jgi:hypothetical protein
VRPGSVPDLYLIVFLMMRLIIHYLNYFTALQADELPPV